MQLTLSDQQLTIELTGWERLWAFHLSRLITIPLSHIQRASSEPPQSNWRELRAPGTFLPGVIKAGTYYTDRGREFWYVTRDNGYLILELNNEFYKRIIITVDDNLGWVDRLHPEPGEVVPPPG